MYCKKCKKLYEVKDVCKIACPDCKSGIHSMTEDAYEKAKDKLDKIILKEPKM
jgi:uncharacterized protein YbaR (Trm112 family)